jgi:trehalose 6-phosphate synthase
MKEDRKSMSRVVLVSNRVVEPRKAAQAGGVAVALASLVRSRPSLWFGWSGEVEEDAQPVCRNGRIATVPLSPIEHERFYLGYANATLWPVFHNRLDLAQFDSGFFEQYHAVNARFAAALQPMLQPEDIIWVHDYHLIPLAAELRALGVRNPIGFYLHIPFPPWQTFMAIPEHGALARGFAAYDLVGLQTQYDAANLIDYLSNGAHGSLLSDGRIRVSDRLMTVAGIPVGINVADFAKPAREPAFAQGRRVSRIIGVDRLDYTKGLSQKFMAFGRFLEEHPQYRREVVLTQIAPPSRQDVEAYSQMRRQLESLAGSINGRFGELDWVPIHYIHRSTPRRRLAGIYRSSRIGMVTPLRDGMNLVAKEYVAAQDPDDPGVLLLSRFAGAAEELEAALIVNPYDVDAMAGTIRNALEMGLDERRGRHAAMMGVIEKHSVDQWCQSFLASLESVASDHASVAGDSPKRIEDALRALQASARQRIGTKGGDTPKGKRRHSAPARKRGLQGVPSPRLSTQT